MANVMSSLIPVTLIMEVLRYTETSVLTRATRHNIPEEGILQSHRCETWNLTLIQYLGICVLSKIQFQAEVGSCPTYTTEHVRMIHSHAKESNFFRICWKGGRVGA
jgi:hypothetical protein